MIHTTTSARNTRPSTAPLAALAVIACATLACSGRELDERDLGNTAPQLTSSEGPAEPGERLPLVQSDGSVDPFVEGHWVGQAENLFARSGPGGERPAYVFPSGSSDFTLDIALDDPSSPNGQIVFGSGAIPEPERGVAYPPGFVAESASVLGLATLQVPPQEGLGYDLTVQRPRFGRDSGDAAGALTLSYLSNLAYLGWCALQLPSAQGDSRFSCLSPSDDPDAGCSSSDDDGVETKYECNLFALCGARNVCTCTENECHAAGGVLDHIGFVRDGDDLLGTFVGTVFNHGGPDNLLPVGTVRFERASP